MNFPALLAGLYHLCPRCLPEIRKFLTRAQLIS